MAGEASQIHNDDVNNLLARCTIEALIPLDTEINLNTLLNDVQSRSSDSDSQALVAKVPQKEIIFLDERIITCIILRCPLLQEGVLRDFLSKISITLEAYSVGTRHGHETQDTQKASLKELVDSHVLESNDDPVIAVGSEGEDSNDDDETAGRHVYVLWKQELHIARTHIRASNPSLYLSTAARLRADGASTGADDEYMVPFQPESMNLFQALQFDHSFKGKQAPVLSAARLLKHTPAGAAVREQPRPLKNLMRTLHRLVPAVNTRLKCTSIGGGQSKTRGTTRILACVQVEVSPAMATAAEEATVELETVKVDLENGQALAVPGIPLPRRCVQHDLLSFVYDLAPDDSIQGWRTASHDKSAHAHVLSLDLTASVRSPGDDYKESRKILTRWRTTLDLSPLYQQPPLPLVAVVHSGDGTTQLAHTYLVTISTADVQARPEGTLVFTISVSNTTSSPARSIRVKVEPLIGAADEEPDLIALKPSITTYTLTPGGSATRRLEFKILGEGLLKPPPLRIVEINDQGREEVETSVEIPASKLPDVFIRA